MFEKHHNHYGVIMEPHLSQDDVGHGCHGWEHGMNTLLLLCLQLQGHYMLGLVDAGKGL